LGVKNAFLHDDLSETVYMHQPPGFQDSAHPDYALLQQIITSLHQEFSMTDLGSLNYFLGILVTLDSSGMFLSQKKYVVEIIERAHMINFQRVCLYMHDPREPHFLALKQILQYAGYPTTLRSTSGYYVILGNNLLSWSSKRQPMLSCSSAEAEYRGVANVRQRTKHIEIDIHFVRDLVAAGQV
ncbi:ribonuclease H-like domain-containing protein, partial [Tanacetum coccineum]